jgi:HD-like signal output (HDOD) protein
MHAAVSTAATSSDPRARAAGPLEAVEAALAAGAVDLPVLPKVAHEVMIAAGDPKRGAAEVARAIEKDPALCATVLRAANSAMFGSTVEIVSARQAVLRLGLLEVATLATTAAMRSALVDHGAFEQHMKTWWRDALATALFAKEIARLRRQAVDSAFLCGLLREVGVPVILRVLSRSRVASDAPAVEAALARHARTAGLLLCDAWQLTAPVRAAIADVPDPKYLDHVCTARLAAAFARGLDPAAEDVTSLNLDPEELETLVAMASTIAATVESMA